MVNFYYKLYYFTSFFNHILQATKSYSLIKKNPFGMFKFIITSKTKDTGEKMICEPVEIYNFSSVTVKQHKLVEEQNWYTL